MKSPQRYKDCVIAVVDAEEAVRCCFPQIARIQALPVKNCRRDHSVAPVWRHCFTLIARRGKITHIVIWTPPKFLPSLRLNVADDDLFRADTLPLDVDGCLDTSEALADDEWFGLSLERAVRECARDIVEVNCSRHLGIVLVQDLQRKYCSVGE